VKRREAGTGSSSAAQPAAAAPEAEQQASASANTQASSSTAAGNPFPSTSVPTVQAPLADDGEHAIEEEIDSWVRQVGRDCLGHRAWVVEQCPAWSWLVQSTRLFDNG
jgi:hypothetical protein